jgi:hypothetical protein
MKTMYRTWFNKIEPVEVIRLTENSVYLPADARFYKNGERRQQRINPAYESFFDTWGEARDYLVSQKMVEIRNHETTLKTLNKELDKILELKNEAP